MTESVATPSSIRLFSRGGTYDIASVRATFTANGINAAEVDLAVGRNEQGNLVNIAFDRGDDAAIFVNNADVFTDSSFSTFGFLRASNFTLFSGVIDDFGPSDISYGAFTIRVRILGNLVKLTSGTLQANQIVPTSYLDTRVPFSYMVGKSEQFVLNPERAANGFFSELRRALLGISEDKTASAGSVTSQIQLQFSGSNLDAAEQLLDTRGELNWDQQARPTIAGVTNHINELFGREWFYESIFNRIITIGEMLRFAIVENGSGIKVVPYHPFFRRADAVEIPSSTYNSIQHVPGEGFPNYSGAVMVSGGGHDSASPGDLVMGQYKRLGSTIGQVFTATAPPFFSAMSYSQFFPKGAERRATVGNVAFANILAKILTWELNYKRGLVVSSPTLRTDIAPLSAVRVDFPNIPEIQAGTDTPAVYGSVQKVTVVMDASRQYAATTFHIGYVRSYQQQEQEIDPDLSPNEHPFWNTNSIGGRLDSIQERGTSVV